MSEKPPVVIELTTNLRTGVTVLAGITAAPCPKCKSQKTTFVDGEIVCKEGECQEKTKVI